MTNPNDPAFPSLQKFDKYDDEGQRYVEVFQPCGGLTKRELMATIIIQGLCAAGKEIVINGKEVSHDKASLIITDSLIIELNKEPK